MAISEAAPSFLFVDLAFAIRLNEYLNFSAVPHWGPTESPTRTMLDLSSSQQLDQIGFLVFLLALIADPSLPQCWQADARAWDDIHAHAEMTDETL